MASVQQSLTIRMKMICAHLRHSDGEVEDEEGKERGFVPSQLLGALKVHHTL